MESPVSEMEVSGAFSEQTSTRGNSRSRRRSTAGTLQTMIESGSMVLQEEATGSSCWRPPSPTGNGAVPYLDIMVVNSAQYPKTFDGDDYGTHTRLLIEPISIPSLKHTGINLRPLPTELHRQRAKVPLFYPDGGKSVQLRHNIRDTLKNPVNVRGSGARGAVDLDSMEHWNKDGGSRVLVTDDSTLNHGGIASSSSSTMKRRMKKSSSNKKKGSSGSRDAVRRGGPASSVSSSRAGARKRTAETREVLHLLHGTLEKMDTVTGRR